MMMTTCSSLMMMTCHSNSDRLQDLQRAITNLMMYYHLELREHGVTDTRQELATCVPKWIHLSEDQSLFVCHKLEEIVKLSEMLENIKGLLVVMKQKEQYDKETVEIVLQCTDYLSRAIEGEKDGV